MMDEKDKKFFLQRIAKMQDWMHKEGMRAVVLSKPENVLYFSGFNPVLNSQPVFLVLCTEQEPCLLVHSLRRLHALDESAVANVQTYGKWGDAVPLAVKAEDAVCAVLVHTAGRKIGMELNYLDVDFYRKLCGKLQPSEVASVSGPVNMMRLIKDSYEIACIRKAALLVDAGIKHTIAYLAKGASEAEAATEGQYAMRCLWQQSFRDSEVCGFGTAEGGMIDSLHVWCLSNERIAYGCDCPKHYHLKNGDLILPMAWAMVDGYHAENERTLMVGQVNDLKQKAYDSMLKARENIFKILKPGVCFAELYKTAAEVYSKAGFTQLLPGRVGHGVGCSAHEFPSIAPGNYLQVQSDMVITVEPGIMDGSWGGVRHSDTVLITEHGYEVLTQFNSGKIHINLD